MNERRAYICDHKDHEGVPVRRFVGPKDPIPECPGHGKMTKQRNKKYVPPDGTQIPKIMGAPKR
jgi:hypothetical protein